MGRSGVLALLKPVTAGDSVFQPHRAGTTVGNGTPLGMPIGVPFPVAHRRNTTGTAACFVTLPIVIVAGGVPASAEPIVPAYSGTLLV